MGFKKWFKLAYGTEFKAYESMWRFKYGETSWIERYQELRSEYDYFCESLKR